jgi:hypothetical protein
MLSNAVRMALCIECSPAVQDVPGSILDCGALIAPRSECSPMLYAEDVGGPGQAPTIDPLMGAKLKSKTHLLNKFFDLLSHFLRDWLQTFQKVII